jgi:hypothetical protein
LASAVVVTEHGAARQTQRVGVTTRAV